MKKAVIISEFSIMSKVLEILIENNDFNVEYCEINDSEKLKGKANDELFILIPKNRDEMYRYIWEKIRIEYELDNPIICFGTFFLDLKDPMNKIFREHFSSYSYFLLPPNKELENKNFNDIKEILNQMETDKYLETNKEKYFEPSKLIGQLINHDLKNKNTPELLLATIELLLKYDNNQERKEKILELRNCNNSIQDDIDKIKRYLEDPTNNTDILNETHIRKIYRIYPLEN